MRFCSVVLLASLLACASSRVTLIDNGYSNIVVAISSNVPKTQATEIIKSIKWLFSASSTILYQATRQRAYFKSVRILIPQTWDNIAANVSTWETFEDSEVQIDLPRARYGNRPYTSQPGGCGQPGEYIHLTPDYLLNINGSVNTFGRPEKLFVTQWAHLRYGVFEEFGTAGDPIYPLFYRSSTLDVKLSIAPNTCHNINPRFSVKDSKTGGDCRLDPQTGVYDVNCTIVWASDYKPDSSLMSFPQVDSLLQFCDEGTTYQHNREAPTKHNALCGSQSVWSVISRHGDFSDNQNKPRNITYIEPDFNIVRREGARFVLVADVSGSMNDYERIGRLNRSGRRWIQYDVSDGSQVGIVQFQSVSNVLSNLVTINNSSRANLASKVPSKANGGTCIGCGLRDALNNVLGTNNKGGIILLLTDGVENVRPYVNEILPQLIASQARVVSIAFGRDADNLIESLAQQTGGKSYFINDDGTLNNLNSAFTDSLTYQPEVPAQDVVVKLLERKYQNNGVSVTDTFFVDSTVGRDLNFRLEFSNRNHIIGVQLASPSQTVYKNVIYDISSSLGYIQIDIAEEGEWRYQLNLTSTADVRVSVTSKSRSTTTVPITTVCSVLFENMNVQNSSLAVYKIIAKVLQGRNAVIGATVKAYIEAPDSSISVFDLFDNGVFADTVADDGIYSRYFVAIPSAGRYTVMCQVWNSGSAYIDNGFIANSAPLGKTSAKGIGNFTRTAVGGSININKTLGSDPYPPGRVVDLKVIAMNVENMTVTLQWTSPGDNLDDGKAKRYQVKFSNVFDRLLNDFASEANSTELTDEHVVKGNLNPLNAGSKHTVTFAIPGAKQDITYFFALRAVDAVNKSSETSNIASIQIVLSSANSVGFNAIYLMVTVFFALVNSM